MSVVTNFTFTKGNGSEIKLCPVLVTVPTHHMPTVFGPRGENKLGNKTFFRTIVLRKCLLLCLSTSPCNHLDKL